MWDTALGVSSFVVMPLSFLFLVYAAGNAIFTLEWKMLLIAALIFVVAIIAHTVLGILVEG